MELSVAGFRTLTSEWENKINREDLGEMASSNSVLQPQVGKPDRTEELVWSRKHSACLFFLVPLHPSTRLIDGLIHWLIPQFTVNYVVCFICLQKNGNSSNTVCFKVQVITECFQFFYVLLTPIPPTLPHPAPTPRHYSAHDVVLASAMPTQVSGISTIRWSDGHNPSVYSHTCQSSVYAWGRSEGQKAWWINNLPKVRWALKSGPVQPQNLSEGRMEAFFLLMNCRLGEQMEVVTDKYLESVCLSVRTSVRMGKHVTLN